MNVQQYIWKSVKLQGRGIATKFGIGLCLALLALALMASLNPGSTTAHAANLESYTIVYGDTLSGIASRFGVSVAALAAANGIADPNVIYAGQTIQIPDGNAPVNTQPGQLSGSYVDMIYQVFGVYGSQAVSVSMCESSLNPNAYNGILGAAGLFQIIPGTWASTSYAGDSVYNPAANIQAAYEIFARDGYTWSEWACKP